jgi:hypothetical protein
MPVAEVRANWGDFQSFHKVKKWDIWRKPGPNSGHGQDAHSKPQQLWLCLSPEPEQRSGAGHEKRDHTCPLLPFFILSLLYHIVTLPLNLVLNCVCSLMILFQALVYPFPGLKSDLSYSSIPHLHPLPSPISLIPSTPHSPPSYKLPMASSDLELGHRSDPRKPCLVVSGKSSLPVPRTQGSKQIYQTLGPQAGGQDQTCQPLISSGQGVIFHSGHRCPLSSQGLEPPQALG